MRHVECERICGSEYQAWDIIRVRLFKGGRIMEMTPRERFLATAAFEPLDRPFRMETIGFWRETLARWQGEGLPPEAGDEMGAFIHFGVDLQLPVLLGAHEHPGFDPLFDETVIEQDERYIVKIDKSGARVKVLADGASTIPAFLEAPVKDEESWEEVKWRLDPETPGRLEPWMVIIETAKTVPFPLCVYISGLFGTHRHLLGFTPLMLAYRRQPQLLHAISRHWVAFWKGVLSRIAEVKSPDMVMLWEDMCYLNGPMIGPDTFEAFMLPYYKELIAFIKGDLEVPVIGVDSDGRITKLIPFFVAAGVNFLWPFEVQAGMDVLEVRRQWPRQFVIIGGMDKRALYHDRDTIRAEVLRVVPPMLAAGGYIPSIDHAVPPEVSLDNWLYFLELVRETGGVH
jgi:uroporphyrinogen decarboxylase